jgi:hypothetical protein
MGELRCADRRALQAHPEDLELQVLLRASSIAISRSTDAGGMLCSVAAQVTSLMRRSDSICSTCSHEPLV